ncbi:DUF2946 domain-containing protein [Limnohabitans sp.]|jgi:hypothetical protein
MTDGLDRVMRWGGLLHRRLAWLALCALLFGVLAPTVSKVLAASQGTIWLEVCSSDGTKRIAISPTGDRGTELPAMTDSHCAYCFLQQHSPFLPTALAGWSLTPAQPDDLKANSSGANMAQHTARTANQTRAPPNFS